MIYICIYVCVCVWVCYIKRVVARKGQKHSYKSNKKTSEKFNNCIKKQETKGSNNCVGEYENVWEIEKKNVRRCIDKNELILGNLTCAEW